MERRKPVHDFILGLQPYLKRKRRLRRRILLILFVLCGTALPIVLAVLLTHGH